MTRATRILRVALVLAAVAAASFFVVTRPMTIEPGSLSERVANVANGQLMFDVGGCASCHATPGQTDRLSLGGGLALNSPFGSFKVPNVSSDPATGIGKWTEHDFLNALLKGTGRRGEHLFPSFPFTAYQRMSLNDARDLYAYMKTLPAVARASEPHALAFPFNQRFLLGGWKLLFLDGRSFVPDQSKPADYNRGAYLTEALGHCVECHSKRNLLGGISGGTRYAGGPTPDGKGWVPNITQHADGLSEWTQKDLVYFLGTGVTPNGAPVDEEMGKVIANTSRMSPEDRAAMAAYLAALPRVAGRAPKKN